MSMTLMQQLVLMALAVGYLAIAVILAWRWKAQLDHLLLFSAAAASALWLALDAVTLRPESALTLRAVQLLQVFLWLSFLLKILHAKHRSYNQRVFVLGVLFLAICVALILATFALLYETDRYALPGQRFTVQVFPVVVLLMALAGWYIIWRITYRGGRERRQHIRLLCLAVGFILFYHISFSLQRWWFAAPPTVDWLLQVALYAVAALLMLKSLLSRGSRWMGEVYLSRDAVMYSAGALLVIMGVYSFMLSVRHVADRVRLDYATAYLILALICLAILVSFFSTRVRAHLHVFIAKHFFNYRYDYRQEWLRLIRTLSKGGAGVHLLERVVQALAQIVGSEGGVLWINRHDDDYEPVARWGSANDINAIAHRSDEFIEFLEQRQWVVDYNEFLREPELYEGMRLPDWLLSAGDLWLVVPLMQDIRLLGLVTLVPSPVRRSINWEDRDLLKTAGRQAATHIAQLLATQALMEAQEFTALSRLSAFVVHDLKNVVGQLELITKNAAKHRNNPDFIADTFDTVESAARRGQRLLAQLRDRSPRAKKISRLALVDLLQQVTNERAHFQPAPGLDIIDELYVHADSGQLKEVISHLVENAQQATAAGGSVTVKLYADQQQAVIEVLDTGVGMDATFIRERLFRPFDSTKGEQGMGIGVYQSREIARSLGGGMDVESTPGVGSKFRLRLPIVE